MIEIVAKLNNIRHSPRKIRTVANEYKRLPIAVLRERLVFSRKKAAQYVLKAVNSAVANATNNLNLKEADLSLTSIVVGDGRRIRKPKYRARGRMDMTLTRYSNIRVVLSALGNVVEGKVSKEINEGEKVPKEIKTKAVNPIGKKSKPDRSKKIKPMKKEVN